MDGLKFKFAIGGAALAGICTLAGSVITARWGRTHIEPQPVMVALEKEFVGRQEFDRFLLLYREDIRKIEDLVRGQQAETAAIRNDIFKKLGLLEGTLNVISGNVQDIQRREGNR